VKPYQPPNVWEAVAMFDSTTRFYTPDTGASLYRRSLYTFVKRAALHPAMDAFNAPSREVCTIRRERANTPLQARVLWNDPQLVEAERRLAENALRSTSDRAARLDFMAERLLARKLKDAERDAILPALDELLERQVAACGCGAAPLPPSRPDPRWPRASGSAWTLAASQLRPRPPSDERELMSHATDPIRTRPATHPPAAPGAGARGLGAAALAMPLGDSPLSAGASP
jgi:hypothetical protein